VTAAATPFSRASLIEAVGLFLSDAATVAGFDVWNANANADPDAPPRPISAYVMERPILTEPDPWFYAGLIALECVKVMDLFTPKEAATVLRRISLDADAAIGRAGRAVSRLAFALVGRLGYGAVIMHTRVPEHHVSNVILMMMGNHKTWSHLLPDADACRQVRAAIRLGNPTWWHDYRRERLNPAKPVAPADDNASTLALTSLPTVLADMFPETARAV
jgi:hypothetical protein